jgi:hypothetical protein
MSLENENTPSGDDAALFKEVVSSPVEQSTPQETAPKPEVPAAPVASTPVQKQAPDDPRVPLSELLAERKSRQALERQMSELIGTMRASAPKPEVKPAPEIWDDPTAFVRQQITPQLEQQRSMLMYNARLVAETRFTEPVVKEAIDEFDQLRDAGKLHPADYSKVMDSPNPFAEAVKWHNARKIANEIGDDPVAFKTRYRQQLMSDPEFRKEFMASMGQAARSAPMSASPPPVSLPSLSKVGSSALPSGNDADANDDALWANAIGSKRR